MRKRFLLPLLVLLMTTLSTHAYDFQSGDLYYNITSETTVEVTYQTENLDNYSGFTKLAIPETVTYENLTYFITSIGERAFEYCASLTSITIGNKVTSIGDFAFAYCFALTSVSIPQSVTSIGDATFYNCWELTSISIPESITDIGSAAFDSCNSLTSITIPNFVTSIKDRTFIGCSSLTSITIPNSVTSIGKEAFFGCSSLTSITIPNSVTSIGDFAFDKCSSLTSFTIPNSVTSIGDYAFMSCSALTSVTIGKSVTSIGKYAFANCSLLTNVTSLSCTPPSCESNVFSGTPDYKILIVPQGSIHAYERTIPWYGFYSIESIAYPSINILSSDTVMGYVKIDQDIDCDSIIIISASTNHFAYHFIQWNDGNTDNPRALKLTQDTTFTTEFGLTYSGKCGDGLYWAYSNKEVKITGTGPMYNYTDSTMPWILLRDSILTLHLVDTITSIGDYAFDGCASLSSVIIPNLVTSIGEHAFYDCSRLSSITIGKSVTNIGQYAFYNCLHLASATSLSCIPPSCENKVFFWMPSDKTLIVPSISKDDYKKNTPWSTFTNIEEIAYPSLTLQSSDSVMGIAQIDQDIDCDSIIIISATTNHFAYQFVQWSDGNTDNPRTIKLTQDTTLIAEFGLAYSGKCGDDLYWAYSNKEVKITGTGAMYNYTDSTMPWTLLRDSIKTVRVGNNATSIGEYAFANTPKLAELHIGANVEDIGANAFAGCTRLYDIYCYSIEPPFAQSNSFANYNVYVYVPCKNQRDYSLDVVWGEFKFVECIGSEDAVVSGNEVTVSPDYEDATFTWPVTANADSYSLVITKDAETFCTLVFNAQGQLLSIAFKPGRGNAPSAGGDVSAPGQAEMTANGFRFKVTGLDEGAAYMPTPSPSATPPTPYWRPTRAISPP